jgi:predicted transcriptional regulator
MPQEESETPNAVDPASGDILISISQANAFAAMVEQGKFASIDDAIAQSTDELGLTKIGNDKFSAEAIERIREGLRQADRGELISSEEVDRKFDEWFKEIDAREAAERLNRHAPIPNPKTCET